MVAHILTVCFASFMIYTAWPGSSLFSWHPTLMTLAFIMMMFEGLLVFNRESSLFLAAARQTKILVHQILQICAVSLALLGLAVIYYNKTLNKAPHFTSWHGLFGITTVVFITIQAFGGDLVRYQWLRELLRVNARLADLKIYHATSGLIGFTLVTTTLMLSLYSKWFTQRVDGVLWYACLGCVSFMAVVVMNQVVSEYLPRTRGQRPQGTAAGIPIQTKVTSKSSTTSKKAKKNK